MTRRPLTALAAMSLMLLTACSDDDTADPPATTDVTTTSESSLPTTEPTTTVPPTTSSTPTTTEPPPTTPTVPPSTTATTVAADDWPAILTELARRRVALYAAPNLSRIGEYCAPDSDCAQRLATQLGDYINRGEHIEGQHPFTVVEVLQASLSEEDPAAPGAPRIADILFVVGPTTPPAARIVDSNGNVVDTLSLTTTNTKGRFTLISWDDPTLPWRVLIAEDLGPVN